MTDEIYEERIRELKKMLAVSENIINNLVQTNKSLCRQLEHQKKIIDFQSDCIQDEFLNQMVMDSTNDSEYLN